MDLFHQDTHRTCSLHLKCTGTGNLQSRGVECPTGIGSLLSLVIDVKGRNQISEAGLFPFDAVGTLYIFPPSSREYFVNPQLGCSHELIFTKRGQIKWCNITVPCQYHHHCRWYDLFIIHVLMEITNICFKLWKLWRGLQFSCPLIPWNGNTLEQSLLCSHEKCSHWNSLLSIWGVCLQIGKSTFEQVEQWKIILACTL